MTELAEQWLYDPMVGRIALAVFGVVIIQVVLRSVRYGSNWEYARETLRTVVNEVCGDYAVQSREAWKDAVQKYRLEEANIDAVITLAATDNWIQFTARYVVDYRRRRFTKDRLFMRLLEEVDWSNNKIRLASATFEIANLPRFDISMQDGKGSVDPKYVP